MSRTGLLEAGRTPNQHLNDQDIPTSAAGSAPSTSDPPGDGATEEELARAQERDQWLQMARDAYQTSEDYFDASIRAGIERNIAHFAGRHAPGSKYYTDLYKYRARGFRPKTRSVVRRNEAKAAIALFSTAEAVNVEAENDSDPGQIVSAEINQEIISYRLDTTIPWYQIAIGAYQDTLVTGICISHQYWDYEEQEIEETLLDERGETIIDNDTGQAAVGIRRVVVKDTPKIDLRPIENVGFSPGSDWTDPINTSPYIVDRIPMEIGEVKERMDGNNRKSRIPWYPADDGLLRQGLTEQYDPVRSQREGQDRTDSKDQSHQFTDFDEVWVHRNIIRRRGVDYVYYTLGVYHLLSDPIPLTEEYPHLKPGQRPYVMGVSNIETHKTYPESLAGLSSSLQQEANDVNNQRRDNVQLVLNRRYYARRGAQIDYRSLVRNVPGSVTEMDDVQNDIRSEAPPEVTASSYQEQDRINVDFDELTGSFSTSSVSSNRQLNETVGGMELMSGDANEVTEYQLRTFVSTWVKPVLMQIIQLEQRFETDEAIFRLAGNKIQAWQKYGIDQITDRMLQGSMTVKINVGFGSTNPDQRIKKIVTGVTSVINLVPNMRQQLDGAEVAREIFGAMGYDSADRFFPPVDPQNPPAPMEDPKVSVKKMEIQADQQKMAAQQKFDMEMKRLDQQYQQANQQAERRMKLAMSRIDWEKMIMTLAKDKDLTIEQIKAKLAESAMRERNQNQRLAVERAHAATIGKGRGL